MKKVQRAKKNAKKLFLFFFLIFIMAAFAPAEAADEAQNSSLRMMEEIEKTLYGETSKGGLIGRLASVEEALFGRELPGQIAERHAAILNFLEIGTEDQPSTLFKLGVAEWIVDKRIYATKPLTERLETLEMTLRGEVQYGQPIVMRLQNILSMLVTDPVTAQTVTLPTNQPLKLRFMDELSPAKSKAGDQVRLELTNDLIVNRSLIAPAGSLLLTEVREVQQPRRFGVPGEVRLTFNGLKPLGPERPKVTVGEVSQKAIEEARKVGDRGEGTIIGAGAVSIAGAAALGPVGLLGGLLIRGNSLKIPEGAITFVQTDGDTQVSAYPIPESLRVDPASVIQQDTGNQQTQQSESYDPQRDTIIKKDVFNRPSYSPAPSAGDDSFELPPEQQVN